ncbi:MAG: dNTP triphosphohydrolase [Planctomycetota bacterium]
MIRAREQLEALEEANLASYAARSARSRGRVHTEEPPRLRTAHQRDRDRVIHSEAFRRLQHKTQVFVVQEGDAYRTRLTHTIEVSQIARSLAAFLGANVDLADCIALMHDLGHPPFGHQGEVELDGLARAHGLPGFDHNLHCLRIVDRLERRYDFPGLNLTWEAREGIGKHATAFDAPETPAEFRGHPQAGVEGQIANVADMLAYVTHDLEDALYFGFFALSEVERLGLPLVNQAIAEAGLQGAPHARYVRHGALTRRIIGSLVQATLDETERRLARVGEAPTPDAVRAHPDPVVALPEPVEEQVEALIGFLLQRVYRHPTVEMMCDKGRRLLRELFEHFLAHPNHLPRRIQAQREAAGGADDPLLAATFVLDFLAGVTDRHVVELHHQVFDPRASLLPYID